MTRVPPTFEGLELTWHEMCRQSGSWRKARQVEDMTQGCGCLILLGKGRLSFLWGPLAFPKQYRCMKTSAACCCHPEVKTLQQMTALPSYALPLILLWPTLKLEGNFLSCLLCLPNLSRRRDECKFHLPPPPRGGGWGSPIPRFLASEMQDREEKWVCIKSSFQKLPPCKMQPGAEQVSANVKIKTEKFLSKVECL